MTERKNAYMNERREWKTGKVYARMKEGKETRMEGR